MENKNVGWLVIGIAVIMMIIVIIFNIALKDLVGETCTHGPTCSMFDTISLQTWVSASIVLVIFVLGIVIMFAKPKEKIMIKTRTIHKKTKKIDTSKLDKDEKKVIEILREEKGGMFQADLKEKLAIGKVKLTRLLDKLESKQLIERKRRGMNNMVVLIE